jgi:predicted Zn-dependent protease with MMP-like domain
VGGGRDILFENENIWGDGRALGERVRNQAGIVPNVIEEESG